MERILRVSINDAKVGRAHHRINTTVGSCIAVILYDKKLRIGGMLHLMLAYARERDDNVCKYADTGIPHLIRLMVAKGASINRLLGAKIAGGAMMLTTDETNNVAKANIAAAKAVLRKLNIQVIASDCGGTISRRIIFDVSSGKVLVEAPGRKRKIL
ncbi:MAG: chemotaxis protein CheD [Proteobacteria bacterium]|nr:chemotaxis protein CheD [Pseudomonadota bacterium]